MLRNYFITAYRYLTRQKGYTLLNITGLTFGMACFLLIALYVVDELSFDAFHQDSDQIYRLLETKTSGEGKTTKTATVAYNVSAQGEKSFPQIVASTRSFGMGRANISNPANNNVFYDDFWMGDQNFLKVFSYPLLEGDAATVLQEPYSVVITPEIALKLFGDKPAMGELIQTDRFPTPFKVTGIFKEIPSNSHLSIRLLFSEATMHSNAEYAQFIAKDWTGNGFITYIKTTNEASIETLTANLNKLAKANRKEETGQRLISLQPLKDIHFHSAEIENNLGRTGDIFYVYVFSIIAFFVLTIACINYMNLSTARSAKRAKEVGVRKVIGANRSTLMGQFLTESLLIAGISLVFATLVVHFALPAFNEFTEKKLSLDTTTDIRIWLGIFGVTLLVGILSGSYPAFFLSRYRPYEVLKGVISGERGNLSLRRMLVICQFTLSITMIIATLLVYTQLQYVRNKNLGFDKEQLVIVDINSGKVRKGAETIKSEYAKLSQVKSVTVSSRVPGEWKNLMQVKVKSESNPSADGTDSYILGVDEDFTNTFAIHLLQGRNFNPGAPADSMAVLINETAAKALGIQQASEQLIDIPAVSNGGVASPLEKPMKARVIGIVKDFHFQSLHQTIAPMILAHYSNPLQYIDYFTVRLSAENAAQAISQLESILHQIDPAHLFEYHFLDEQVDLFYREDIKRESIFIASSFATIFIACLGLFGLAAFTAQQRTKEIGIRKVLGASVGNIVTLLSKDFLTLVLISFIVSIPLAWMAMHQWLQNFAYRIEISWWIFALAGILAISVALLTVSFQAIKAALANPVKSLRNE
ncbi:FtsX-like permease family protein [Rhodocytophaga rosea]|uniref:FtsX-like permease family protein n=1 Tax=Rhodocytophaga rosea TaxID=2704465 RepID=A0A6C0GSD1_9BACT|nr:ABC transporter permease [Rhodocytophaga rosea]QHT70432.1 FtsX-like permease family protein [Rhodocytophaga rosea]